MEAIEQNSKDQSEGLSQTEHAPRPGPLGSRPGGVQSIPRSDSGGIDSNILPSISSSSNLPISNPSEISSGRITIPSSVLSNVEQIQSLIKEHAIVLKRFNQETLTAEIRPDSKTSITLSLHSNSDGITVNAQLDPKNSDWIKTHWHSLQSKLAEQNIFLEEPTLPERSPGNPSFSEGKGNQNSAEWNLRQSSSSSPLLNRDDEEPETQTTTSPTNSKEHSSEKVYWA